MPEQPALAQLRLRPDGIEPPAVKRAGPAHDGVDFATLAGQELRQMGTVLPGHTGYESLLRCHSARNAFTDRRLVTSQLGLLQDPREGDETIKIGRRQSKSAFLFLAVLPELVSQSSTAGKRRSRKSLPRMRKRAK